MKHKVRFHPDQRVILLRLGLYETSYLCELGFMKDVYAFDEYVKIFLKTIQNGA